MDQYCSNLWNTQNENRNFEMQCDYINHMSKIRNTTKAIDNKVPFQPHHIYKLRYYEKCGYKRIKEHEQFINENLVQKIEDLQKTNIKYNKDFLIKRIFDKKSLNFDARMNNVQQIMNKNVQMANMIKNCKPSVQNSNIKKQSDNNNKYKQNILKNSKRIFNPHLNLHQMNKSTSMTNFQFSEKIRQSICKTPLTTTRSRVYDFRAQTVRNNKDTSQRNKFYTTKLDNFNEDGTKKKYSDDLPNLTCKIAIQINKFLQKKYDSFNIIYNKIYQHQFKTQKCFDKLQLYQYCLCQEKNVKQTINCQKNSIFN